MENQRQPSGSDFGPRSRMSTRSKDGWSRFRSKRMKTIAKDMKKREAYMPRNMRNRNDQSNIDVTNNAHMHSGNKTNECDSKDQDGNIVLAKAKKVPPKDSRARQSSDMLPMNKTSIALMNDASKSKQQLSHISENSRYSPNSRLDNSLVPFMDINASKPSRVKNVLPLRKQENPTPLLSKDGSNTKLGHQRQSHFVETQGVVHDSNISRSSHPIYSKTMTKEAHKAKNGDARTIEDDTLLSESNGQPSHTQGQYINVSKDTNKISKPLKCKRVLKGSNIPLASEDLVPNEYDSNEDMARQDKVVNVNESGMRSHIYELHTMYEDNNKQEEIMKANAASNSSSSLNFDELREEPMRNMEKISSSLFVKDLSRHQGYKASCIEDNNGAIASSKDVIQSEFKTSCLELHKKDQPTAYVGKSNDVNSKRKVELLLCTTRKRRRYIPSIEDGANGCNNNLMGVDILKGHVEQPCNYCSKPINEPTWSGIFKMDGKEYISLVGHLSTKSCEKVWKLSKSLPSVVEVERISRSVACPRIWKASEPNGDNIGLYLLPHNMRHDEELDRLVNEVKDDDLVLRAVINEAEMLIFPSTLLPKRYQTFQAKHYLWAVFKPREDKGVNLRNH